MDSHPGRFLAFAMTVGVIGLGTPSVNARLQSEVPPSAQGLETLLERVGQRVRNYYERAAVILCTERVLQQALGPDLRPRGKPRETIHELLMVREGEPSAGMRDRGLRLERTLRSINGRAVRPRDQPACTDPKPISAEPLAFLLPDRQARYRFSRVDASSGGTVELDFEELNADPPKAMWEGDCFTAHGGRVRGRLWIDAGTDDVLQFETHLAGPFTISGAPGIRSVSPMRVERSDTLVRLRHVTFDKPQETLLLPESVTTTTIIRGAQVPRIRTSQTFSEYRRFISEGDIRGGD